MKLVTKFSIINKKFNVDCYSSGDYLTQLIKSESAPVYSVLLSPILANSGTYMYILLLYTAVCTTKSVIPVLAPTAAIRLSVQQLLCKTCSSLFFVPRKWYSYDTCVFSDRTGR